MPRSAVVVCVGLAGSLFVSSLAAQRTRFGAVVGRNWFGGNRTVVVSGSDSLTGARETGLHLRAFVDMPITASAFSFRGEVFYSQLTSGPQTYVASSGSSRAVKSALRDRTGGITGSFVGTTNRASGVAPYFALGAGLFVTRLGYNPEPGSPEVARSIGSMGLGLVVGGGLRIRTGTPTLLLDWRYYQPLHATRGSAFMPLSLGVVF